MPQETFQLWCEQCKKDTRHAFAGEALMELENLASEHIVSVVGYEQRYFCTVCDQERRWGMTRMPMRRSA